MICWVVLAGCTTTEWDSDAAQRDAYPPQRVYPRNEAGIMESMIDWMSNQSADLNVWNPSPEEAKCVADRYVRRLGVSRILTLGYDPNRPSLALQYTPEERQGVVNILQGCVSIATGLADLWSSSEKIAVSEAKCMADGVRDLGLEGDIAESIVDGTLKPSFDPDASYVRGLAKLAFQCLDNSSLSPVAPLPNLPESPTTTAASSGAGGGAEVGPNSTTSTTTTTTTTVQ